MCAAADVMNIVVNSFWSWLGTILLVCSLGIAVSRIVGAPFGYFRNSLLATAITQALKKDK